MALALSERFDERLAVEEVRSVPHLRPRYNLAIAFREGGPLPFELAREARDEELFDSTAADTALLYAALVVGSFIDSNPKGMIDKPAFDNSVRIADFEQATPVFRWAFYRGLLLALKEELLREIIRAGRIADADTRNSRAAETAVAYAENLMPPGWLRRLEADSPYQAPLETERWADCLPPGPSPSCLSCAVSLLDEHNKGPSDRFCRFCSDEAGKLKPHDEVQQILARWFQRSGTDLADAEAARRAACR